MQYGVLCLLPPAAMLIFALKTKKSFEALIFGTLIAYLIMYKAAFIGPWCDLLLSEISNADNQYILLLCGLFGGFIFLLREAKGTLGFSNLLSRFCKNERITMMMSVFLGIIIFVDDYLNIMTVGTCMKDVCDKRKVPRQARILLKYPQHRFQIHSLPFSYFSSLFFTKLACTRRYSSCAAL